MKASKLQRFQKASQELPTTPDDQATRRVLDGVYLQIACRARRRKMMLAAAAALLCLGGAGVVLTLSETPDPMYRSGPDRIRFADGSTIRFPDASDLNIEQATPTITRVHLTSGHASFSVTPNPRRVFEVQAAQVTVRVLGTTFKVDHVDDQVRVHVTQGRVQVISPSGRLILQGGEQAQVPAQSTPVANQATQKIQPPAALETWEPAPLEPEAPAPESAPPKARPPKTSSSASGHLGWVRLAQKGLYDDAAKALKAQNIMPASAAQKMLAADTMRLTHDPAGALVYLKALEDTHPGDPQVPQALFIRGGLLAQRGDFVASARAFSKLGKDHPNHLLAEHALAKEASSWSKSGQTARAQTAAATYLRRWPKGPRALSMQQLLSP